jgi:penicillin-binding protein 2
MDTASPRMRMSLVGVVVIGCFMALFARLWYLQVMEAPRLQVQAIANRTRVVAVEAPRGRILDANGKVLVDNRTSLIVTIDRAKFKKLPDGADLISRLADVLTRYGTPTKVTSLEKRYDDRQFDDLHPVPVATDVAEEVTWYLSEHADEFPSVAVERQSTRVYPYGAAGGNVLGYVGRITAEKLKVVEPGIDPDSGAVKSYQADSTIGLAGVEATYEKELRGTPGVEMIEVDSKNRPVGTSSYQAPKPGNDIQLHIDIDVQLRAEQSLQEKLLLLRGTNQQDGTLRNATAGSVVVLDPQTGGVIALATYPTYDPREFVNGISQERYDQLTDVDGVSALIDRSISGQYAPGSTFKLVTATAALSNGLITGGTSYNDQGEYTVGNPAQTFTNAGSVRNGTISLPTALTISSDVYFYWLGDRMDGSTLIQDTAAAFGFDKRTGIDLPNESSGYVLTPADKKALHAKYPDSYLEGTWYTGDNVQLAVGQNVVVVTPLQLARAYAALANGGTLYTPHVAWRVLRSKTSPLDPGGVISVIEPVVSGTVDLPPDVRDPIVDGLSRVTTGLGTATSAFIGFDQQAFPVVGKTGTAQVVGKADTSFFASYGPTPFPRYAVTAVMEESGFGAEASGEVVRHVYELLAQQTLTDAAPANSGNRD